MIELLEDSGIPGNSSIAGQFLKYLSLLQKWNSRVNLTASSDWNDLKPLFAEAIWSARSYPEISSVHLDIGSGAGFPAIPVKLLRPEMSLDLVESRGKRAVFLATLVDALSLEHVRIHDRRLSEVLEDSAVDRIWNHVSWKAIRLERDDLAALWSHTTASCEFWVYHGKELPIRKGSGEITPPLELSRSSPVPGTFNARVSIYKKKYPVLD